ncbi:MAG: hypothetical protein QXN16_02955 [Candidatus Micrarchaeaceae archaeon]
MVNRKQKIRKKSKFWNSRYIIPITLIILIDSIIWSVHTTLFPYQPLYYTYNGMQILIYTNSMYAARIIFNPNTTLSPYESPVCVTYITYISHYSQLNVTSSLAKAILISYNTNEHVNLTFCK